MMLFESERFFYRELQENDVSIEYLQWFDDTVVQDFIVTAKNTKTIDDLKKYVRQHFDRVDSKLLGIYSKENKKHIANIKYEPIDLEKKNAIMGILIGELQWRNKGVAKEAILASSKWLKETNGIDCIILGVDSSNIPAISSYNKIGFKKILSDNNFPESEKSFYMKLSI